MSKGFFILLAVAIAIVLSVLSFRPYLSDDYLPQGDRTNEKIVIEDGQVIGVLQEENESPGESSQVALTEREKLDQGVVEKEKRKQKVKEIFVTDGERHSVPLDEILGGGPPRDGIPSIDNPKFVSVTEGQEFLSDEEPGISVSVNNTHRFYPYQILVWHEIVNDSIDGERLLVTYCPLCLSGIVFDPLVQGERVAFGTSGKLWNSNLVMYDRKTESLWSQVLGEAIVGDMTGTELSVLPSDIVRFGEWKKRYPTGEVLSRDTGATRFYGSDPYGDYYTTPGTYFPVNARDNRLADKDFVLGIVVEGKAKAYSTAAIKRDRRIEDTFAGKQIMAEYVPDLDVVRLYEKTPEDELVRINPFPNFWFSWVAAHPDTELYK